MPDLSAFPITAKWPAQHPDRIQLYSLATPNGQKVGIALEELGLLYEAHKVNIQQGDQFTDEFKAINPNSKIPAIVDPNGPGGQPLAIFESGAILLYLAEKAGKLLPADPRKRSECIQWLFFQMANVGPMFGQFGHFYRFAKEKLPYAIERYTNEARRLYRVIDDRLGKAPYLAGDYSIADMATYPWAANHQRQGVSFDDKPNLKRWYDAIAARPAVTRATRKVEAMPTSRDHAKPDDVDRFFGRGRYARP